MGTVQFLCYGDNNITTSLLFVMATHVSRFKRLIIYGLQHLGCEAMTFKPEQTLSVRYVYDRKDVFLWLPTGFAKSQCYEILPFCLM